MDRLWSPWRYRYVTRPASGEECIFCRAGSETDKDAENFVVHRGRYNFVILNIYPYTSGHLMVAPFAHVSTLVEAPEEALAEMMQLTRLAERHLREVYRPDGLNIGMNIGKAAGAGVANHIHMHVLPRWSGDANFMTAVGETRVMPESLSITFERLTAAWKELRP